MFRRLAVLAAACALAALPLTADAKPKAMAGTAAMPTCAASDPVVWVNTTSKVYHPSTSRYYGKTKHGQYLCTSQAVAMGAKAAGAGALKGRGWGAATPAPAMGSMHGKRHKKGHDVTPMASPTPSM